ncbi:DUF3068 domain-containing protein [Spirillospora albida]|uniref:DUF3068 domain-containing protein n=1 Tax=Spirillospora albida TaxID=58123 RepID=UPI0004C1B29C|nr:DUF3068 domain-containing protein [Spirillospora albida]
MRKFIGHALTGAGAFLLVGGALVRFQVAPALVGAPVDTHQVTRFHTGDGTLFDAKNMRARTGVEIVATNTTRGDVKASGDGRVVWDSVTIIEDLATKNVVDFQKLRAAFDRRTGELTNCCKAAVQDDPAVKQSGLAQYWPIGLEKKEYQVFDISTRRAWPAKFDGKERVNGVLTHRYQLHVPATKVAGKFPDLPPELLGQPKGGASVPVDRYVQLDNTYWVDPRTGVSIDQRRRALSTLQPRSGGPGRLVVAQFDLRMTPESRAALTKKAEDGAKKVRVVEDVVPLAATGVGLITLSLGVAITTSGRGRRRASGTPAR